MDNQRILLVIVGIVAIVAIVGMVHYSQSSITGMAAAATTCNQVCTSTSYTQWGTTQQDCLNKCCASGKMQCAPLTTSTGMIRVRRIKQVASVL